MALQTQVINIVLGQGLDTKSDPRQLSAGKLSALENGMFTPNRELTKRPGFGVQPVGGTAGVAIATYNNELIELDGQSLWSLSQGQNAFNNKGTLITTQVSVTPVIRNTHSQSNPDSAINGSYSCFAWYEAASFAQVGIAILYSVFDNSTGQSVVNAGTIASGSFVLRVVALGTNFFVIYYDVSSTSLLYKTISTSSPTVLSAAGTIATDINQSTPAFDCSVFNSKIYIAYPNNSGTKASLYSMTSGGTLSAQANVNSTITANVICIFGDASNNAWVGYSNGGTNNAPYAFVLNSALSGTVLAPTPLAGTNDTIRNFTGYMSGANTATFFWESKKQTGYVSDPLTPNYISTQSITSGGTTGTAAVWARGCGLASKVFTYNSNPYVFVATQSQLQNSYFLLNGSGVACAKISPSLGGGYAGSASLPAVNSATVGTYQIASLVKDNLESQSGTVFTQNGVKSAQVTFSASAPSKFNLGNNLHFTGGLLQMYDGQNVTEHGYNVYPEGVSGTFSGSGGVIGPGNNVNAVNQYQYQAVYEWVDNQGQTHRSAPNPPLTVNIPASISPITFDGTISQNSSTVTVSATAGLTVGMYLGACYFNVVTNPHFLPFPYNATITSITGNSVVMSGSTGTAFLGAPISALMVATNYPQTLMVDEALSGTGFAVGGTVSTSLQALSGTITIHQTIIGLAGASGAFTSGTYISGTTGGTYTISGPLISFNGSGTDANGVWPFYISQDQGSIVITVPTLKITQKQKVSIGLYRTELNQDIFYRVNPTLLTYNDPTVDSATISDAKSDNQIVGNEQLYTTGGEVENIEVPAPQLAVTFKSRAIVVPSENPLEWWYAKQVIPGSPVEFNDSFVNNVDAQIGEITAAGMLDEKIIFFGPTSKYYVVGDGPAPSGLNNDFTYPQKITGNTGCTNQASILEIPTGLIYQDPTKGIHLLDRALQEQYIGADVEQYNTGTVTSAQAIPGTKMIRLTLGSGIVLTYDYFSNQWGADQYASAAIDSTIFNDQFTWLPASGTAFSENSGTWTDNGSFIPISLTTGWMNIGSMQGFQRIKKLMILGTYFSPHTLNVNIYTDYNDTTPVQTVAIPVFTAPNVYQYQIFIAVQKCEAIKVKIYDTQSAGFGQSFSLSSLSFEVGIKRGAQKLSAGQDY